MRQKRIFSLLACVLCAGVALPVVSARTSPATFAGRNGRIAFTGCIAAVCDVYTVNPDGTGLRQVTRNGASFLPAWAPDGTRIAYASAVSGSVAIWIADADGTHARQLTPNDPNAANLWPRFMPNGKTILYTNCLGPSCDGGISAVNVDGSGQRPILPNSGDSYNLAVPSPNGERIVFMRWHVGGVMMGIYELRLGSAPEHQRRLTPPQLEDWAPDWAPDGETILFSSNINGNRPNGAIYSLGRDEASDGQAPSIERLTHPPFPLEDWSAAYSPDGARIVFVSDRLHPDRQGSDLFTMRPDGSHVQPIQLTTPGLQSSDPQWGTAPLEPAGPAPAYTSATSPSTRTASALRRLCAAGPLLALAPPCATSIAPQANPAFPRVGARTALTRPDRVWASGPFAPRLR
jgi:Tol biopolymer transport system component